jgi:hypothetical protein
MDLFRKHKKKQAVAAALGTKETPPVINTSYTDQLDQIAISIAEMETEAAYSDAASHEPPLGDNNLFVDANENSRSSDKLSTKSAIDALLDSDDDDAEIFNDLDGSSGDDIEDDVGASSLLGTPTSKRSTVSSSKAAPQPVSALTSTSIMAISPLSATSSVTSKNPKSSFHSDLFDVLQNAMDVTIGSGKEDKAVERLNSTTKEKLDGSDDELPDDEDESMSNLADEDNNDDPDNDEKTNSDSAEDYSDDEDEGEDGYKPGGYHSVKIGEIYNQRYAMDVCKRILRFT